MSWRQDVLAAWLLVGILTVIAGVGKPRRGLSPGQAATAVAIDLVLLALVVTL